jgi:hypothetical protein
MDLQLDGIGGPCPHVGQIQQPLGLRERLLNPPPPPIQLADPAG